MGLGVHRNVGGTGGEYGEEGEIELRQLFELEDFGEGPAIDRARELDKELGKKKV